MAGKHVGADVAQSTGIGPPNPAFLNLSTHHYHPKEDKAYAEGRLGLPASNPHPAGSESALAYVAGAATSVSPAHKFETAVP